MPVNSDKPQLWKADVAQSVDLYNQWFINFAPAAYRSARGQATIDVEDALRLTNYLNNIEPVILKAYPSVIPMLRMATAPPIARDRLIGLASVPSSLINSMEKLKRIPPQMLSANLDTNLQKIGSIICKLVDRDIFTWLDDKRTPTEIEIHRAATIVADRLCGAVSDPIIRNTQEERQLKMIKSWLEARGYSHAAAGTGFTFDKMLPGSFMFRLNIKVHLTDQLTQKNIPVDVVVKPKNGSAETFPLLIEAKSAGDFTNTNKRRKEEAIKVEQLRRTYGNNVKFILFLCGYFDTGYLGYEAAEGIDWVWEHRIDDLAGFGV
jgi:hypothetical protein